MIRPKTNFQARLATPITFTDRIRPVRIPPPDIIPHGPAALAGWGSTSNGIGSGHVEILQKAMMTVVPNNVCIDAVNDLNRDGSIIDDGKFCTGPMTGGNKSEPFNFD